MQKSLEEKSVEIRNEYIREWRRNNKDKVREYNRRYWLNRAKREVNNHEPKETV